MELTYDWRGFQGIFYPQRRPGVIQPSATVGPVHLVVEGDVIIAAYAEHEDLSDWIGASYREVAAQCRHREVLAFDRGAVDKWVSDSLDLPQFYDQVDFLRRSALPLSRASAAPARKGDAPKAGVEVRKHFLIDAVSGWWSKVLPSSYGIYLKIEGSPSSSAEWSHLPAQDQDFLLLVRRGSFDGFHEPDLASLGHERRKQPAEVVRYLSERYLVPVQGVFVSASDWAEWSKDSDPWMDVARSIRASRAKLVPFRWGVSALAAARAFLGV